MVRDQNFRRELHVGLWVRVLVQQPLCDCRALVWREGSGREEEKEEGGDAREEGGQLCWARPQATCFELTSVSTLGDHDRISHDILPSTNYPQTFLPPYSLARTCPSELAAWLRPCLLSDTSIHRNNLQLQPIFPLRHAQGERSIEMSLRCSSCMEGEKEGEEEEEEQQG